MHPREEGCITYSQQAILVIESLSEDEQKKIARDLHRTYGTVLRFSMRIALQSYVHTSEFKILNHIAREQSLFIISDKVFFVRIDKLTFNWYIERVDLRMPKSWCEVIKIA